MISEEMQAFRDLLRRFVDRKLIPLEGRAPITVSQKTRLQEKAKKAGLWMLDVPLQYGGQGLDLAAMSIFWHEISRTISVPARDYAIFGPNAGPILLALNEDQKRSYLFPVLASERNPCFAQTESDAGSDPSSIRTTAVRSGEKYIINGAKRFITGAKDADFAQVVALTSPDKKSRGRMSCFIVDMDAPGVRISAEYETMMGDRPCEIVFEDVEVSIENLVGKEGEGLSFAQSWINHGRIRHGARACGVAERCLELTAEYVKQRKTFGEVLANRQGVQWTIADCHTELHATTLMVRDAAAKPRRRRAS